MPREKESEHKNIFICFLCRPEKIVRREGKVKKKKNWKACQCEAELLAVC